MLMAGMESVEHVVRPSRSAREASAKSKKADVPLQRALRGATSWSRLSLRACSLELVGIAAQEGTAELKSESVFGL
jgi:hypothetical protein